MLLIALLVTAAPIAEPHWDAFAAAGPGYALISRLCGRALERARPVSPQVAGVELSGRFKIARREGRATEDWCGLAYHGVWMGWLTIRSTNCDAAPRRIAPTCARPISVTMKGGRTTPVPWSGR